MFTNRRPFLPSSTAFDNLAEAMGHKERAEEEKKEMAAAPDAVASGILLPDVTDFNYG